MRNHRLVIPAAFLRDHKKDSIMLMRIGAGANAMEVSQRLLLKVDRGSDRPVTMLARVQCAFVAIGYWREIVKMIEKEGYEDRLWALVEIAVANGVHLGLPIGEARELLSPVHPTLGGPTLLKLRDKIGFHWDPQPFEGYLDDPDTSEVIALESDGDRNADRIFRGSSDAMSHYFFGVPAAGQTLENLLPLVAKAQGIVGPVVEAGFYGLIVEAGEDPRTFWHSSDEA